MAKRAKKTVIPRNSKASLIAEENQIGQEVVDWSSVDRSNYRLSVIQCLNHYNYFYDYHDAFKWAAEWVKENMTKTQLKHFKACPDIQFPPTAGRFCRIMNNGGILEKADMEYVKRHIENAIKIGSAKKETKPETGDIPKKTPADIVREKTSDFIAEIEERIDNWKEWDFSVFQELKAIDAPYNLAKGVYDYYTPLRDELSELVTDCPSDLDEGYQHMGKADRKKFLKIVEGILSDAEMFMMSKKAVRKTRKKKETSAPQQVSKLKYLKESKEFKLSSIDPTSIVGATDLYLFNTKYRQLTYLVTSSKSGFAVKGTTIQNVDIEASYKKTIRKPDEFLVEFMTAPKVKTRKLLETLKTNQAEANGRTNEHTIILKRY